MLFYNLKGQTVSQQIIFYMHIFLITIVLSLFKPLAADESKNLIANPELLRNILEMCKADQEIRLKWVESKDPEIATRIVETDAYHYPLLEEIVNTYGYPGYKLVGEDGEHAFWLLIQHADQHVDFQNKCLHLLEIAVDQGDASALNLAYLTDRILKNQGKEQIYGTQWFEDPTSKKIKLWPVDNCAGLNARRVKIGLNTIQEYRQEMIQGYNLTESDFEPVEN